jgi:hypothetical protein
MVEVRLEPSGLLHCSSTRSARVIIVLMPRREFDIMEHDSLTDLVVQQIGSGPMNRRYISEYDYVNDHQPHRQTTCTHPVTVWLPSSSGCVDNPSELITVVVRIIGPS